MAKEDNTQSLYSISEFAEKVGINEATLRNWHKSGSLMPAHISPGGHRYYSNEQFLKISGQNKYVSDGSDLDAVRDKVVLITGGTGSLGNALTKRICDVAKKIIIFSRDELKQHQMRQKFANKENIRFMIGDVRDKDRLMYALRDVDICIHCASMKRIEVCQYNPVEAIKTIVIGSLNVMEACIENGVKKVLFISTDKSCAPATLYGGAKFVSEQLFISGNNYSTRDTVLTITRYGNVYASNGSMRHLFKKQAEENGEIEITHEDMTRFLMTIDQAVDLNLFALNNAKCGGEIFIPKLKAVKIVDYVKTFFPNLPTKIIGVRGYEKIHEDLISDTEMRYVVDCGMYYKIIPSTVNIPQLGWDKNYPVEKTIEASFKYNSGTVEQLTSQEIINMEKDYEQ